MQYINFFSTIINSYSLFPNPNSAAYAMWTPCNDSILSVSRETRKHVAPETVHETALETL